MWWDWTRTKTDRETEACHFTWCMLKQSHTKYGQWQTERYDDRQRTRKLQPMTLPINPFSRRRDLVNSSKTRPINQARCRDSRITQPDIVSSMFQINLCHRFSQYLCWDGITRSCLALGAGSHVSAVNTDTGLSRGAVEPDALWSLESVEFIVPAQLWNSHNDFLKHVITDRLLHHRGGNPSFVSSI